MGDRAQLPTVGRGGVLDHAAKLALDRADIDLVHRFTGPAYAELSLQMRSRKQPADLFDKLYSGGHVRIHTSHDDALAAMVADAAAIVSAGGTIALTAPTNDTAKQINAVMQQDGCCWAYPESQAHCHWL